jgi:periplasmic protein TonB
MKTISWDEIVFRDRNRNYGAYYLRRKYNKSVILSFLGALLIVCGLVGVPMVQAMKNKHNVGVPDHDIKIEINKFRDPFDPPPPPPPPAPLDKIQKIIYRTPIIVDSVNLDLALAPNVDIEGSNINDPVPVNLVVSTGHDDAIPDDEGQGIFNPAEPATFMGGDLADFHAWVQKNLIYPQLALDNNIFGKVIIQFAINSKGELVDIKLLRSIDKSIDEETIRVLKMSPKWVPAKQGGTPTKQLFTMPVSFVLK